MKRYAILLICLFFMTGCGTPEPKGKTGGTANTTASAPEGVKEQTIWQVLDEDGNQAAYLEEEDSDVVGVKQVVEKHSSYVDSRSERNQSLKEEQALYTEEFKDSLEQSGYVDAVKDMYETNQMEISPEGLTWYVSTFDKDKAYCKVTVDAKFHIAACNEDYLSAHSLEKNKSYQEQRIYYLEKKDGEWKISNIEKSALGEVAGRTA